MGLSIAFSVIMMIVGPLGGWFLGRGKGLGAAGFLLGLFLSIAGWIIVAFLPPRTPKSRQW